MYFEEAIHWANCTCNSYMSTTHCPSSRSRNENFITIQKCNFRLCFFCDYMCPINSACSCEYHQLCYFGRPKIEHKTLSKFLAILIPHSIPVLTVTSIVQKQHFPKISPIWGSSNLHSKAKFRADPDTGFVFDLYRTYQCYTPPTTAPFRDLL